MRRCQTPTTASTFSLQRKNLDQEISFFFFSVSIDDHDDIVFNLRVNQINGSHIVVGLQYKSSNTK